MALRHDDLPRGEGKVLTERHVALYRDDGGELHAISSVCTHRACDIGWNGQEKVWDCPCHGSRFTPTGAVIRGPAAAPLPVAEVPE